MGGIGLPGATSASQEARSFDLRASTTLGTRANAAEAFTVPPAANQIPNPSVHEPGLEPANQINLDV